MNYPLWSGISFPGLGAILTSGGWTRDPGGVVRLTISTDQVGVGTTAPLSGSRMEVAIEDAETAGGSDVLVVTHTSTGVPATGLAADILLRAEGADGVQDAARLSGVLTEVTAGAESGALDIFTRTAGGDLMGRWRFTGEGNLTPLSSGRALGISTARPDLITRALNTSDRYVTAAGGDTINAADFVLLYDSSAGNQQPVLPALASSRGQHLLIKRVAGDVSANTCEVTANPGDTIAGATSVFLLAGQALRLYAPSTGTDWAIL